MNNYDVIKKLENIYLEDSYVLNIEETKNSIYFEMEFVLIENHPLYVLPLFNQKYCYKKGGLKFIKCREINWKIKNNIRFIDKNEDFDLGNIDSFSIVDDINVLSGDWGIVEIKHALIDVIYEKKRDNQCAEINR